MKENRVIRVGIIGMGRMGQMYARLIKENAEAELAAFCENDTQKNQKLETSLGAKGFTSMTDFYNQDDMDAVIVSTPDHLHLEPVMMAAERDIHMLIEKPFATRLEDARQMKEAVINSRGINMMAHVFRWSAPFVKAKNTLVSGEYGEPVAMNMRIDDRIFVPTQMIQWAASTTPAWFLLSHAIDLAVWYSQSVPSKVYASGIKKKLVKMGIQTYDLIRAEITFESGFIASLEACWILPDSLPNMSGSWCTLISTDGGQYINVMDQMIHQVGTRYENPATLRLDMYGRIAGLQTFMMQSFIDSIKRKQPVVTDINDGYMAVTTLEAIHQSLTSGEIEKIDL